MDILARHGDFFNLVVAAAGQRRQHRLHEALVIHCKATVMKPRSIERSVGKAVRVVDRRKLGG